MNTQLQHCVHLNVLAFCPRIISPQIADAPCRPCSFELDIPHIIVTAGMRPSCMLGTPRYITPQPTSMRSSLERNKCNAFMGAKRF